MNNSFVMPGIFADLGLASQTAAANGGQVKVRVAGDVTITGDRLIFNIDSGIRARAGSASATATHVNNAARCAGHIRGSGRNADGIGSIATVRSEKYTQGYLFASFFRKRSDHG